MRSRRIYAHDCDGDVITSASQEALALSDPEEVLVSGLDEAIASIRHRTARLAYQIIRREYLDAWCEACDLKRAIEQADVLAFAVLELPETSDGVHRLDEARSTAETVLQLAPTPTRAAIRLAFGSATDADCTLWDSEVEQWLATLATRKPPVISADVFHRRNRRVAPFTNVGGIDDV
jgi:hypothetical protein